MCRSYGRYIRACYRTVCRGEHIPIGEGTLVNGHLQLVGQEQPRFRASNVVYHFEIKRPESLQEEIAEVRRCYQPCSIDQTELDGCVYVSVRLKQSMPGLIKRMQTFDWIQVASRDGLPNPEQREAKAPSRRRGRIEQYAITIVFDGEPHADAITAITSQADDNPRRRDLQQTPSGKWLLFGWRDCGWDRQEWQMLWEEIRQWGGRPYQQGDQQPVRISSHDQDWEHAPELDDVLKELSRFPRP